VCTGAHHTNSGGHPCFGGGSRRPCSGDRDFHRDYLLCINVLHGLNMTDKEGKIGVDPAKPGSEKTVSMFPIGDSTHHWSAGETGKDPVYGITYSARKQVYVIRDLRKKFTKDVGVELKAWVDVHDWVASHI